MVDRNTLYPFEFFVDGVPISLQASSKSKERWKKEVAQAAQKRQRETYEIGLLDMRPVKVTIYYFPSAPMLGDIDNIVKPIIDSLKGIAFRDDKYVECVAVQKFEPQTAWEISSPSQLLAEVLDVEPPVVYINVDDSLSCRKLS